MASDEPAFLNKDIEVSAKYRGAFCEAKVKHVEKNVKCRVMLKEDGKHIVVSDDNIKGTLKIGGTVEVQKPETGRYVEATLTRVTDHSLYTVIFDDGDENTLKRSKLCLKGSRHFMKSETLDDLPLTNPEHFSTPVVRKSAVKKLRKVVGSSESDDEDEESSCSEASFDDDSDGHGSQTCGSKQHDGTRNAYSQTFQDLVGQVLCVDVDDRTKKLTLPVLVVLPSADEQLLPSSDHFLVKSFKDNKFMPLTLDACRLLSPALALAKAAACKDKLAKFAWDKAQAYIDQQELPPNWDPVELLGSADLTESDELSDYEPIADERRDRFVAQLYKFMDDRGTPINKTPTVASADVDLFNLWRLVTSMGGYNRVNNMLRWSTVYARSKLPTSLSISAATKQLRDVYTKYLHAFEDFNRKLGCTMVSSTRPERGRHPSSRSLLSFRDRSDPSVKSMSRTPVGRRPSSMKDDTSTSTVTKSPAAAVADKDTTKDEPQPESLDSAAEKSDSSASGSGTGAKTDFVLRATRKTPKRIPADAAASSSKSSLTESKSGDELTAIQSRSPADSKDQTSEDMGRKIMDTVEKAARQRRVETLRMTRADVVKTKHDTATTAGAKKSDSSDDKPEKKPPGRPPLKPEEKLAKKKAADSASDGDKKTLSTPAATSRLEGKRSMNLVVEKVDSGKEDKPAKLAKRTLRRVASSGAETGKTSERTPGAGDDNSSNNDYESGSTDKDEERVSTVKAGNTVENYAIGTRLRVKYGKAPHQKIYEAKVLEVQRRTGIVEYRVHYAGWNTRYDEWIRREVIVSVIEEPVEGSTVSTPAVTPTTSSTVSAAKPKTTKNIFTQMANSSATPSTASKKKLTLGSTSLLPTPLTNVARRQKRTSITDSSKLPEKVARRRTRTRSSTERTGSPVGRSTGHGTGTEDYSSASSESDSASETDDVPTVATATTTLCAVIVKNDVAMPDTIPKLSDCAPNVENITNSPPVLKPESIKSDIDKAPTTLDELSAGGSDLLDKMDVDCKMPTLSDSTTEPLSAAVVVSAASSDVGSKEASAKPAEEELHKETLGSHEDEVVSKARGKNRAAVVGKTLAMTSEELKDSSAAEDEIPETSSHEAVTAAVKSSSEDKLKPQQRAKKKTVTDEEMPEKVEKKGGRGVGRKKMKEEETADESTEGHGSELEKDLPSKTKDDNVCRKTCGMKGKVPAETVINNTEDDRGNETGKEVEEAMKLKTVGSQKSGTMEPLAKEKRTRRMSEKSAVDSGEEQAVTRGRKRGGKAAVKAEVPPVETVPWAAPGEMEEVAVPEVKLSVAVIDSVECLASAAQMRLPLQEVIEDKTEDKTMVESVVVDCGGTSVGREENELLPASEHCSQMSSEIQPETVEISTAASCESEDAKLLSSVGSVSQEVVDFSSGASSNSSSDDDMCQIGGTSPVGSAGASSISLTGAVDADEEQTSTKSELEANLEVAAYMGSESNNCGLSSDDDDDDDGDSGAVLNVTSALPKRSSAAKGQSTTGNRKRKSEENVALHRLSSTKRHKKEKQQHRTRSQHRLATTNRSYTYMSDSDDAETSSHASKRLMDLNTSAAAAAAAAAAACSASKLHHSSRCIKYNFLDLKDGRQLEGEDRISFLMSKIQDLRSVYMQLKAEVACIDRRRRRHRVKDRDAHPHHPTSAGALSSAATVTAS